jgi:hypothetical protein
MPLLTLPLIALPLLTLPLISTSARSPFCMSRDTKRENYLSWDD